MSVNFRTIALLVLFGIIPLLLGAAIVGQFYIQEKQAALDEELHETAGSLATAVARELDNQKSLLSLVTDSPRFDPPIRRAGFEELAQRFRKRIPQWEMIHLAGTDGKIRLRSPTATADAAPSPKDMRSFEQALATDQPIVGNVLRTSRDMVTFAIRQLVERQKASYVLSILIRPDVVADLLFKNGLPSSWTAWVIDGNGNVVAATSAPPSLIGTPAAAFFTASGPTGSAVADGTLRSGERVRIAGFPVAGSEWSLQVAMPLQLHQEVTRDWYRLLIPIVILIGLLCVLAIALLQRELTARRRQADTLAAMQRMDALGKLTGGVAHDFNNLLMVFQGAMEGLKRRRNDETKFAATMDMMAEGIARGKAITDRLLSFSRRSNQDVETLFLQDRVEEFKQLVSQALTDRVTVRIELDDNLWPVAVDRQGLEIALINLATNAKEAMPQGGRLTIRGRNADTTSGAFVTLTVTDEGDGIKPADIDRVFEPFFTTKGGKSIGLGLSQVYGFANRNGGKVRVDSIEGEGASFTIYLPRSTRYQEARRLSSAGQGGLPRRILLVDDTPDTLAACKFALEAEGVQVITAVDGVDALRLISTDHTIRHVLSDVMMPNMSGLELADRLRRDYPEIAVVLMTGYSEALEAGVRTDRPVVAKPFAVNELVSAFGTRSAGVDNVVAIRPAP
jgi:signal transduction histidine kinase/ActR/RegA family two-component response regulator